MILLKRLGQVLVHLGLDTFFSVTKHGMGSKCDDWRSLGTETSLVLTDLGCSLESTLHSN